MTDTQWPRYEVFQQSREGLPHENAGSIHAPDPEIALQNARDVFVRRPAAHSLWVIPAEAIYTKTAEELAQQPIPDLQSPTPNPETYQIFSKQSQRNTMTYVTHIGSLEARSPQEALHHALQRYGTDAAYVWWICPERLITRSQAEDIPSMFTPAEDKAYRMPNQYRTVTKMHNVRKSK